MKRIFFVFLWCGVLGLLSLLIPLRVFAEATFVVTPTDGVQAGDTVTLSLAGCGKAIPAGPPTGSFYTVEFSYQRDGDPSSPIGKDIAKFDRASITFPIPANGTYRFSAKCIMNDLFIPDQTVYASLVVDGSPPASPKILNGSADSQSIFVQWNKVGSANRYEVYWAREDEADYTGQDVGNVNEYHIGPLTPETRYLVYVKACNNSVCSKAVPQDQAYAIRTGIPPTPTPSILPTATPTPLPAEAPCTTKETVTIEGKQVERCSAIRTDFGDIPTDPAKFITKFFGIVLGIAGGIAVLLIIYSGYKLVMSEGDPERIKGARETIMSAIVGLLFIIFSFVIYQIVANDILKLNTLK